MLKKIIEMLNMQNQLNTATCGENWVDGICKKTGKPINWDMAILDECAELLGSTDFKWWKSGENDLQNQRLEIVDIWHFLLSKIISDGNDNYTYEQLAEQMVKVIEEPILEPSMDSCILGIANSEKSNFVRMQYMFIIMDKIGMDFRQLHSLYIMKNWLNHFRVSNGYKDGTYVKNWKLDKHKPAMEDNDILASLVGTLGLDQGKVIFSLRYTMMISDLDDEK